jgi:hypothetical protein
VVVLFDDPSDPTPFSGGSNLVNRLFRHVREYSYGYYLAQARRVKKWEKSLNKATQQPLLVRYCIKVCDDSINQSMMIMMMMMMTHTYCFYPMTAKIA